MFEDEREIVVVVAMPGVAAERCEVAHEAGALVVRGTRPLPFAGAAARACASSRFPTAPSSAASRCRRAASRSARRELAQGCLVLRLRKVG